MFPTPTPELLQERRFLLFFDLHKSDPVLFPLYSFIRDAFQYVTSVSSFSVVACQVSTEQIWEKDNAVVFVI